MLCLTFPENGFSFVTQKLAKNWKMPFSDAQNIRFWLQGSFKTIFLKTFYDQFWVWMILKALSRYPRKWFQLPLSIICKKLKNGLFKPSEHLFFQNHFLKCLPWPTLDLKTLCFAFTVSGFNFIVQKCGKNWKLSFLKVQNICFWLQGSFKTIF